MLVRDPISEEYARETAWLICSNQMVREETFYYSMLFDMGSLELSIFIIGAMITLYVILECVHLFLIGGSLVSHVRRFIRHKLYGAVVIPVPDDLRTAAANGLIGVGSEVIIGYEHDWDGISVKTYAISPSMIDAEAGTKMKISRMTRSKMELMPLSRDQSADAV